MNPDYPPDIEAKITFLKTEEGGRSSPAFSGYRPQFYYNGMNYAAHHHYPNVSEVNPGQTVTTLLWFGAPQFHFEKIYVGMEFEIREGVKVVGNGIVTKILNLEKSAKQEIEREKKISQQSSD